MALMTWEVVCLVLALISTLGASLYFIIKCLKSIRALNKEATERDRKSAPVSGSTMKGQKVGLDMTQVYGVPYRPPTPPVPQPLDPGRLEALVMGRKSDLHPKYLEFHDVYRDRGQSDVESGLDQQVSWRGDSALLESEFMPSMTESPMIELRADNSSIIDTSLRPRKVIHIDYDRGTDGAPEIMNMTTGVLVDDDSPRSTDIIKNSTPKTPPQDDSCQQDPEHMDRGCAERWVSFDGNMPSVIIQDEDGFIHEQLKYDA